MHRGKVSVQYELYDCTGKNWSHQNSNERLKEKFGRHTRNTFNKLTTNDSCTWNITQYVEHRSLKLEA